MNRFLSLLPVLALAACASVPTMSLEQKCDLTAVGYAIGQDAKNRSLPSEFFEARAKELETDENAGTPEERAIVIPALRRGFAGLKGADPDLMAMKIFDDCMMGK